MVEWNNDDYAGMLLLDRMNESTESTDALHAFALDELLCRQAGEGGPPICHLWRHPRAFILGQRDARLPQAAAAIGRLTAASVQTAVRSSGGAAVPLDMGVVNVSLILPIGRTDEAGLRFNHDFERMYALVRQALASVNVNEQVDKGEIAGAYCPGDYDLSIGGLKFCGIAQRRQAKALIVHAFVVAEGSGRARAAAVRAFYDEAAGNIAPSGKTYPHVEPGSTASLEELTSIGTQASATFAEGVKRAIRACQRPEAIAQSAAKLRLPDADQLAGMIAALRSRYHFTP
ncbi:lipoate--protein ligase family protein [Paenibacillus sp. MMS18-CY102]|uniref:lipoate--protein ligase family protein n=1 Tax=Paenibacillus sp. MMS18-CY102 TaxID=2682849 RepID=UPI0013656E3E|nr:lipoate--protein ligase family protein [Paenibacillus sp. MMS18-CY102]MWC29450.1 lipoate--protein ligase family protein [Paenibacillus sp. MMS18-CY102]